MSPPTIPKVYLPLAILPTCKDVSTCPTGTVLHHCQGKYRCHLLPAVVLLDVLSTWKGLVTPRDHGFFSSKNHVIEEILKSFVCQYLLFWVILKNQQSDFHIFTFSKCKDDLTGLFTSQPIAVVALLTAPVCRLRAPSSGAPTVCPLAPHPAAPSSYH